MESYAPYAEGTKNQVSAFFRDKFEREASKSWDKFYARNSTNFFRDRHWLSREWHTELTAANESNTPGSPSVLLEVGCGVGNAIFPLVEEFPNIFVRGVDFSKRAIDLVKSHSQFNENCVWAEVCDVSSEPLMELMEAASVDLILMCFVLSAVPPARMPYVLRNVFSVLKSGGRVLFRDMVAGDLAEKRFEDSTGRHRMDAHFYVKSDGTFVYFFSPERVEELFRDAGFVPEEIKEQRRTVVNRKEQLHMDRAWIQATFSKPHADSHPPPPPPAPDGLH